MAPTPPRLISPVASGYSVLLSVPNVTPLVPSTLVGHNTKFEIRGYSGYSLSAAGATPLIVLARPSNVDTAYFLSRVVDQASLGDAVLTFQTIGSGPPTIVEEITLHGATVDAVATGWLEDVVVLRYTTLSARYSSTPGDVTAPVAPNLNESVAPDFSHATSAECGACDGVFHGDENGQSSIINHTTWNETHSWNLILTHTAAGPALEARATLAFNPTANTVMKRMATQPTLTRFDLRTLRTSSGQQIVPTRVECQSGTLGGVQRGALGAMELRAALNQCVMQLQQYSGTSPQGPPVTFTFP